MADGVDLVYVKPWGQPETVLIRSECIRQHGVERRIALYNPYAVDCVCEVTWMREPIRDRRFERGDTLVA